MESAYASLVPTPPRRYTVPECVPNPEERRFVPSQRPEGGFPDCDDIGRWIDLRGPEPVELLLFEANGKVWLHRGNGCDPNALWCSYQAKDLTELPSRTGRLFVTDEPRSGEAEVLLIDPSGVLLVGPIDGPVHTAFPIGSNAARWFFGLMDDYEE